MPESIAAAGGGIIGGGVHDDPDRAPEPTADAPRGWTWNRKGRHWSPRQRGPVLFQGGGGDNDGGQLGGEPLLQQEPQQQRDPDPAWMRDDAPRRSDPTPAGRIPFEEVPQEVKNDIAGLMGLVGIPILTLLERIDPYCGGALRQNLEPVVDAALPLICRSSKIVRYFSEDKADWLLWGKLGLALQPVGQAILDHHVFRRVQVVRDEHGNPVVVHRVPGGEGDHLTPQPQPEPDYAYQA